MDMHINPKPQVDMLYSSKIGMQVAFLLIFYTTVYSLSYDNYNMLEGFGVACPYKDSCKGYSFDKEYYERSCECDSLCSTYKDCCIDSRSLLLAPRTLQGRRACVPIGQYPNEGIYAVNKCSRNWSGPELIHQMCEGATKLRDPVLAVPVISRSDRIPYKNRYCAECNYAAMDNLTSLQIITACKSLKELSYSQIMADIAYKEDLDSWGIYRLNSSGTIFVPCKVFFDVPSYAKRKVRFCRSNLISTCPSDWNREEVRLHCEQYMAVVFGSNKTAYRNPHCARCNGVSLRHLSCESDLSGKKRRPISFAHFLDINRGPGDRVGFTLLTTPQCPSNAVYDPFFKECRTLECALEGYRVVNGRCVSS